MSKPWRLKRTDYRKEKKQSQKRHKFAKIWFSFDEELGVQINTAVPAHIIDVLVDEGILDEKYRDDEVAIRLAMIALVEDVVNQIVSDVHAGS